MIRFLAICRYMLVVPVIGCVLLTAGVVLMGVGRIATSGFALVQKGDFSAKAAKTMSLAVIEIIDLFLIGIVAYITAVGIYKLFIGNVDAQLPNTCAEAHNQFREPLASPVFAGDDLKTRPGRNRNGRRQCRRINVVACTLNQVFDQAFICSNKRPRRADRLAERAHVDQALAAQAKMGQAATALGAQHAKAMGVVDDQPGIEAFGQRQQPGQVGQVAVHAEYRVGHDQLDRRAAVFELVRQHPQVAVRIDLQGRLGQPGAVNQRGVIELVAEDEVALPRQRADRDAVGGPSGGSHHRIGRMLE